VTTLGIRKENAEVEPIKKGIMLREAYSEAEKKYG
jgi:hypothetical protein